MDTLEINQKKFTKTFRIGSFDTDFNGRAKLTSICNYLQEIAGMHADALNWGIDKLMKQDLSWVLTRLKVKVLKYPKWTDEISVETWPTGIEGLFGNRDFKIFDRSGNTIILASSSWLIINIKTKRPARPHSIIENAKFENSEKVFETPLQKLITKVDGKPKIKVGVQYSDIDINQHVNNVKYIKWIIDSCPLERLKSESINELEINFLHEAKYNDQLYVYNNCNGDSSESHFEIRNDDDKIEHCRSTIKWK
ncbi:acyl-[acyl-carrier-protein] thioesterase [Marinifilum sp.]|uniref:acyl-[acyl-carrier-protein] thioesterase n=1 Tax=Marinifilum sp. TaxID=2033137 RepID=UPI003BA853ED